jgi:hypothetical protein
MKNKSITPFIAYISLFISEANAVQPQDVDRLTTYTTILGRAAACQIDFKEPARRVGIWFDVVFPNGSPERPAYLVVFREGMAFAAKQQASGRSPDTCDGVRKVMKNFPWP